MEESIITLNNIFKNSFKHNSERIAINYKTQNMTYQELNRASNRVAHALVGYGVKKNTKVALLMSNCLEYVVSELGIYLSGGTMVPLNDMLREKDIHYILKDSGANIVIVGSQFYSILNNIKADLPELKTIIGLDSTKLIPKGFITWEEFQNDKPEHDLDLLITPDTYSKIIYSGGTTGLPKGVVDSYKTTHITYLSIMYEANIMQDEKILLMTPLPHAAGLYLMAGLINGAEIFIESKFDPQVLLEHVENKKITFLSLVPTMIYRILDFVEGKNVNVSSIRTIQYGTAPIVPERLKQAIDIFGKVFIQTFGQQETQNVVTWLKKKDHHVEGEHSHLLQSCGQPTAYSLIKIVDDYGNEVPNGVRGEIAVKTITNMIKYHNMPDETARTMKDGWVYTSDIGMIDDKGYLYLLDRKKDMIITGGMNVYPSEVEKVIQEFPGVKQVAVISVPDNDWGEAVTAFIIRENESVTVNDIQVLCKQELTKYKVPKSIHLVDFLPLTPYGKVDKKTLRSPYWEFVDRQI